MSLTLDIITCSLGCCKVASTYMHRCISTDMGAYLDCAVTMSISSSCQDHEPHSASQTLSHLGLQACILGGQAASQASLRNTAALSILTSCRII